MSRTDAKGQTTTYQYDVLNRVIQETRADSSTVAYTYDAGVNGLGRLTGLIDGTGASNRLEAMPSPSAQPQIAIAA